MRTNPYLELKEQLLGITHLGSLEGFLDWDLNVNVPSAGHRARAVMMGYIAGLKHDKFTSDKFKEVLARAGELAGKGKLKEDEKRVVTITLADFEKAKKLPVEFVAEFAQLCGESNEVWIEARAKSNFKIFEPYLTRIVLAKRQEAEYLGYEGSPYDALMDDFEPGLTSGFMSGIFIELKPFLVSLLDRIRRSKVKINNKLFLSRKYEIVKQSEFIRMVVEKIGFDFCRGRMDVSIHPFCESVHPTDVRITTRFKERDFVNQALLSLIHEAGHGLYEQGLLEEYFGTPLGEPVSLGIHESQSRLWENQVGKSLQFWSYFYPKLKQVFPRQLRDISLEQFYQAINVVEPGFIRVDADELTYNLHVAIRFEIEKDLIEGNLEVRELPDIWNRKMKEYFGLKVGNDADGVLQDSHWSAGLFGYFPTYTLGNLYSAQLFAAAKRQLPDLAGEIIKGNFMELREWLRSNIHVHGRRYSPKELILKATGNKPASVYLIDYLDRKYSDIYRL